MSISNRPVLQAVLAFVLVLSRAQPGLAKLNEEGFRFVASRARLVAIVSTASLFILAFFLPGDARALWVIAGNVWGTICIVKIGALLAVETQRRSRRPPQN